MNGVTMLAAALLGAPPAATVVDAFGRVERKVGGAWRNVSVGDSLPEGSVLRTGDDAAALLRFPDSHTVRVGERTIVELNQLGGQRGYSLKVLGGQIWSMVRRAKQPAKFEVETTSAVAGVTGTLFCVAVDEATGDTLVSAGEGSVAVRASDDAAAPVPVTQGQMTRVGRGRPWLRRALAQSIGHRRMWQLLRGEGVWLGGGGPMRLRRRQEAILRRHLWAIAAGQVPARRPAGRRPMRGGRLGP